MNPLVLLSVSQEVKCQKKQFYANISDTPKFLTKTVFIAFVVLCIIYKINCTTARKHVCAKIQYFI